MRIIFTFVFIVLPLTTLKGGTTAEVKLLRPSLVNVNVHVFMYFKTYSGLYVHTYRGVGRAARPKALLCGSVDSHI